MRARGHGQGGHRLHPPIKREGDDMEAINKMFTPEFRNRLDAIIPFGACRRKWCTWSCEKFVMQLEAQLAERNVTSSWG
jgi:ATP-dependent Clp protease ATP-binding subunit ClpA